MNRRVGNFVASIMAAETHCTAKQLEEKLTKELRAEYVKAEDNSGGCGANFNVIVVSECFNGKTPLQRHRLVYKALAEELLNIHAFTQKLYTPADWKAHQEALSNQ